MGRTNPTYRDYLTRFEERCQPMRRGLRRHEKPDFDRLFEHARTHADAAVSLHSTDPELAVLLSILLAQQRQLRHLRTRLGE
jgi:predicted deacylase